ncbi:MAG: methyltransferase domain-containing protein [Candidatus Altiarchaeales archaeon]|nr:methyltransferase domain-containing protein [Candidatus Altiarchaeales archaeon]
MSDSYLFLLIPNDSCSTWLQNNLALCANCVAFPGGRTGKGIGAGDNYANSGVYPNQEINKLFSENIPLWAGRDSYDWDVIKDRWKAAWSQHEHYHTANPKIFMEKSPTALFAADMYVENFDNVQFIIMTRNPYAMSEGMRRTINRQDVTIGRCIKHWVRCAEQQIHNYQKYKDIALELTYEELVRDPRGVEQKIREFIPALHDVDLNRKAEAHSIDGLKSKPLMDFNSRHIQNLSSQDIREINRELEKVPEILEYFGYKLMPVSAYMYTASEEEIEEDRHKYELKNFPHVPFSLEDSQLLELGKKFATCLLTQDFEKRVHDYAINEDTNKPWKYLQHVPKGSKVLFVGAGAGREVVCGQEMGFDAYGVTMGSNNINFGREILGLDASHFVNSCIELLPFPAEFFDVVAGFQIFEHAMSPLLFLLEQGRVLKDGGELVLEWPPACAHSAGGDHPESPHHQVCYTPGQGRALLMKAGFRNVSLYYKDMSPIPEEKWWQGEQGKGYTVAKANKLANFENEWDEIDYDFILKFREL